MNVTIRLRRDTASAWTDENPVLAEGELGLETDTGNAKLGDGATRWRALTYWPMGDVNAALDALNGEVVE